MRIIALSDTHNQHDSVILPDGDILIHAGDWTNHGRANEIEKFLTWFVSQPHKYKLFCAGNHELSLDKGPLQKLKLEFVRSFLNDNTHYLENEAITIEGIKYYFSPASPFFFNWAFNYNRGKDIAAVWAKIPDDTQILITHGPSSIALAEAPRGIGMTENVGCEDLAVRILQLKLLKVHIHGHIHHSHGTKEINGIKFVNAAICTEAYKPTNEPIVIDI